MKEFFLDYHSLECENFNKNTIFNFCNHNKSRFIIFLGNNFYLITNNICAEHGSHLDFKQKYIKSLIENSKIFDYWDINRTSLTDELKKYRIYGQSIKKYSEQINFIYKDNAMKKYAITTKINFLDKFCNNEIVMENYKIAVEFLIQNKYDYLLEDLRELCYNNIVEVNHIEVFKTIDELINNINKQLKN